MPKTSINYQNTIIYKICCNDLNVKHVYVGHTTNFINRKVNRKQIVITHTKKNLILRYTKPFVKTAVGRTGT